MKLSDSDYILTELFVFLVQMNDLRICVVSFVFKLYLMKSEIMG